MQQSSRVLVVDDQPRVLRFIEIDLKARGFHVLTTTSGATALEIVRAEKPDIIVLDIVLPDLHGFEVLKQLRSFSRIPVIAVSADTSNHHPALQSGADAFLSKPFIPDDLVAKIEQLVKRETA